MTGRNASHIADKVSIHISGSEVTITVEIEATTPQTALDNVVRTVTANSRTLKFTSQRFEHE